MEKEKEEPKSLRSIRKEGLQDWRVQGWRVRSWEAAGRGISSRREDSILDTVPEDR